MIDEMAVILVVDDEPDILITLERLLKRLLPECGIITASDGASALALLSAHPVRVALVDYRLPGMDGLALAAAIRTHAPAVQLILLSATIDLVPLPGGPQAHGLFATLPKPWANEELVGVVRAALGVSGS
jgi:CheY-like chemotaxis protein